MDGRRRSFGRDSFGVVSQDGSVSSASGERSFVSGGSVVGGGVATDVVVEMPQRRASSRRPSSVSLQAGSLPGVVEDEDFEDDMATFYRMYGNPDAMNSMRMEKSRPVCEHYDRKCTLVSPCCGLAFGCRICHDECPMLPAPIYLCREAAPADMDDSAGGPHGRAMSLPSMYSSSLADMGEETHHEIDRFAVKEIICRECFTRQNSKTNNCISCGVQFGEYHCNICNLWMSNSESPYHCASCGFCRIGGRENFRHCDNCGMCIDVTLFHEHNCKSGRYMSNCPVCQEDLFSSRAASHELPCGHAMHWHCFEELTSFDSRCPVCKKTAETREEMASTWNAMAMSIAMQPVPEDMAKVVTITCNDCEVKQENRRWHFLGVQCRQCDSFNTNLEHVQYTGLEAVEFLRNVPDDNDLSAEEARQAFTAALEAARSRGEEITEEMEEMAEEMARLDFRMLMDDDIGQDESDEEMADETPTPPPPVPTLPGFFQQRPANMTMRPTSPQQVQQPPPHANPNSPDPLDMFTTNMDTNTEQRNPRRRRASEGPRNLGGRGRRGADYRFFNLRDL